jgi:hypothetical protein
LRFLYALTLHHENDGFRGLLGEYWKWHTGRRFTRSSICYNDGFWLACNLESFNSVALHILVDFGLVKGIADCMEALQMGGVTTLHASAGEQHEGDDFHTCPPPLSNPL